MATITLDVVKKNNAACSNGFQFDVQDYREQGDKNLSRVITIDETRKIKATLYFQEEIIEHRQTGQKIPVLNVCVWTKGGGDAMWSSGLGKFRYYKDKKVPRRNISVLQGITQGITDDFIRSMAVDNRDESVF